MGRLQGVLEVVGAVRKVAGSLLEAWFEYGLVAVWWEERGS